MKVRSRHWPDNTGKPPRFDLATRGTNFSYFTLECEWAHAGYIKIGLRGRLLKTYSGLKWIRTRHKSEFLQLFWWTSGCGIRNTLVSWRRINFQGILCIMNAQQWNLFYVLELICNIVPQHTTTFPSLELVQLKLCVLSKISAMYTTRTSTQSSFLV